MLANMIRISEILPWDRKSLEELYIGCIGTHAYCRQVTLLYVEVT